MHNCSSNWHGPASRFNISLFDEPVDRSASNALKWSHTRLLSSHAAALAPLPMWVADMDFKAPQPVLEALHDAVTHGVFGYSAGATDSYLRSIIDWQQRRFGWTVCKTWLLQTSGVITTLKTAIQAFSAPGDSVLIQTPVYSHFHEDVLINGRRLVCAPLTLTERGYLYDPQTFEQAIRKDTKLFILSSPHNPTGNVWSEVELRSMGEICAKHGLLVIADEIHQDFVLSPEKKHIPFASLGYDFAQNSITCTAPSKSFNLPGLQVANIIVPNQRIRETLQRQLDRNMFSRVNTLGLIAAEAAYAHGEIWLEYLLTYIRGNHQAFTEGLSSVTSHIKIIPTDSLYLAWMDCRALALPPEELNRFMLITAGVWLDQGEKFGSEGRGFMRANLGTTRQNVLEAATRIRKALDAL